MAEYIHTFLNDLLNLRFVVLCFYTCELQKMYVCHELCDCVCVCVCVCVYSIDIHICQKNEKYEFDTIAELWQKVI